MKILLPTSSRRSHRMVSFVLLTSLLAGLACNLPFNVPGIWQPTAEQKSGGTVSPGSTPTSRPQPTPSAPLPPALVESTPMPNSEIGLKSPWILYFNQAMDKVSVEGALSSQPPVSGTFKWLNDATVSLTPLHTLPKETDVLVTISTQARAINGLAMGAPVEIPFRTAAGFQAVERLPLANSVDVDPSTAVVVTFNRPVVPLGADPAGLAAAFTLEPSAPGRSEWLNTSTFIFFPDPGLAGGTKYNVRLNRDLGGLDGVGWANPQLPDWSFTTARPKIIEFTPNGKASIWLDAEFFVKFNQAMDTTSVEKNFSLAGPKGNAAGKFTWNGAKTSFTFKPDSLLSRGAEYFLGISSNAASPGGGKLTEGLNVKFVSVPDLAVLSSEPVQNGTMRLADVQGSIRIRLSSPVAFSAETRKLVSFEPSVANFNVSAYGSSQDLYINGQFEGRRDYTLRISDQLTDKWGSKLREPFVLNFKTPAPQSTLAFNIAQSWTGVAFLTPQDTTIPTRATNIKKVTIGTASLSQSDFVRAAEISASQRLQQFSALKLTSFDKTINLPADRSTTLNLPLNSGGKALAPGLYYYYVQAPDVVKPAQPPYPLLLVVSRIHITLKISQSQALAWAVNLENNQPLANATINFYEEKNGALTTLGTAPTNEKGLANLALPNRKDVYAPIYAVIGRPGEANFSLSMSSWNQGMGAWEFNINASYTDNFPTAYLYTDRPIYRPGQVVNFKGVLRQAQNGRYSPLSLTKVNVKLFSAYSQESGDTKLLATLPLDVSEYGGVAGSFTLPQDAAPGVYDIQIVEIPSALITFKVAEYRKPEIEVTVSFNREDLRAGENLTATVKTNYYFGAPAGGMNLEWNLVSNASYFDIPGGYQTGPYDTYEFMPRWFRFEGFGKYITGGSGTTGQDGSFTVTVPAKAILDVLDERNFQELTFEATLQQQEGEFPVSGRADARLHPADVYIGVKPEVWSGQAKTEMGFSILTASWKKTALGSQNLMAAFKKVTWKPNESWTNASSEPAYVMEFEEIGKTEFRTDGQGLARITFTPPSAGNYMLDVSGAGAVTQILVWVGGEGRSPWPVTPNQTIPLTLDASSYKPGQTASLFLPNPLGDNALALVTIERSKVMRTNVVAVTGSNLTISLPITEEDAPNVYVSVVLIGRNDQGLPDFRMGYKQITVDAAALKLQVELANLPQRSAPGGEVKFSIRVKDQQGKPVQGEFSLAVVDKAVLALTEPNSVDIFKNFYDIQPLGVQNSLSLGVYGQRMSMEPPGRGGGGGGGDGAPESVRQRFLDTAYWNGKIITDANGAAEVSAKLPDNLTTWVITLRGLTKDTRVGEAVKEVVTSKDLLIRPFVPRFLVAGDRVLLSATVNNNTGRSLSVDVQLQASGIELDDAKLALQKVEVPANSRKSVSWWAKTQEVEKVDLLFSARSGDLQDAARPDLGSLPVVRYSSPQTFGTNGVLVEPGERLEVVSLPRSFTPSGGELRLEMAPSLAAAILEGLKALEAFPDDFTEPVLSRLLPNLETYRTVQSLNLDSPGLKGDLLRAIQDGLEKIKNNQNQNGGWGWAAGKTSDPLTSTYALYTLARAASAGFAVDQAIIQKAQNYIAGLLINPVPELKSWQLDRLSQQVYTLQVSGRTVKDAGGLYPLRARLSPWAQAMLALTLDAQKSGDERARTILSDLAGKATRSSTGASWEGGADSGFNYASTNFSTAVVLQALSRLDPASPVVTEAIRFLVLHRKASGCWASSYESAWVIQSLAEALKATGDLSASFAFQASLNGSPLAQGQAGGVKSLTPVSARVPLTQLRTDLPNDLKLVHDVGTGRLYYRAFLQVYRPVEGVQPVQRGININRAYYLDGQNCTKKDCTPITSIKLSDGANSVVVRLTISIPVQMYYVVVEDFIPAGSEILNLELKTSQQIDPTRKDFKTPYDSNDPFARGWGWWWFGQPRIFDDHIRWVGTNIAAGTYELVYRLTPLQQGEFRTLPAHAYQYYFPDVEGASSGGIFKILP